MRNVMGNGYYRWSSDEENDERLEIMSAHRGEVDLRICGRSTYTPVSLNPEQADELANALVQGHNASFTTMSPYGTTVINLSVTHENDEIIFLARFKNTLTGHAVNVGLVNDIVEILRHGAKLAREDKLT